MRSFDGIKVFAGFDAFVDRIFHLVKSRTAPDHYERMESLVEFAGIAQDAAGRSANVERMLMRTKAGGNAALFALAANRLGAQVTAVATVGLSSVDGSFAENRNQVEWIGVGAPGRTDALEFLDGKLMLNETGDVTTVDLQCIEKFIGPHRFRNLLCNSDLVMLGNWTMNLGMESVWNYLITADLHNFKGLLFLDLADPRKRPASDLARALEQIRALGARFRVMLGLNQSEASQVLSILDLYTPLADNGDILGNAAKQIALRLGCGVVIHDLKHAAAARGDQSVWVDGPYCDQPKVTTGAGDHFNAGFALAIAAGWDLPQSLASGVQTSGFYVREGYGPSLAELIQRIS